MKKFASRSALFLTFFIFLFLTGCGPTKRLITGERDEKQPENTEYSISDDTRYVQTNPEVELEQPISNEDLENLTEIQKLDSTAQLLELANTMLDQEQFAQAGFFMALAKVTLSTVDPDEIEDFRDYYNDLVLEINTFYLEYVQGVDVLPEESPTEAVIAGIDEAERETEIDSIATDSMEVETFIRPEVEIDSTDLETILDTVQTLPPIPLVTNRKVNNAIKFYQNKGRKVFNKWLDRGDYFVPYLRTILKEEGMPEDLVYLSMIESGFNPKAYSYAHAAGPWQFITSTARIFGLKVSWWYDERRDPEKSTRAATRYLKKLYAEFDDWYLAFAAYNCGEGRVRRHIRYYGTRDFWKLTRLPRQTRNYVPSFIAAAIIANDPEKYGFRKPDYKEITPVDSILIRETVDISQIARLAGTTETEIGNLNPAIPRWCTPPDMDEVWVYLPHGTDAAKLDKDLKALPPSEKRKWIRHKVRRGEALSTIARRYNTTVRAISDVKENKIRSRHRIREGQILNIPVPTADYKGGYSSAAAAKEYSTSESDKITYTVRRGDNLSIIAQRFGTSVSSLRRWNKLYRKKYIHPGQKLTIHVHPSHQDAKVTKARQYFEGETPETHTVKRGDTAWDIAQYYQVSLRQLLAINDLTKWSKIRPGDKLYLPKGAKKSETTETKEKVSKQSTEESEGDFKYYKVRRGDNLSDISAHLGVSVDELKQWNSIRNSNKIKIGQRLKYRSTTPEVTYSTGFYTVRRGDNLSTIASRLGISMKELKRLNGISNSNKIKIGDKLKYEIQNKDHYTVRRGDNLSAIAEIHGMSIRQLMALNGIRNPNRIRAGDRLTVSNGDNGDDSSGNKYIVRRGDTLWDIARAHNVSVSALKKANRIGGGKIRPSDELVIPVD